MENKDIAVRTALTISTDVQAIINNIIENGGEITPEQETALDNLKMELTDKIMSICHIRKRNEANIEYWKAVKQAADDKLKACENTNKWLADYIAMAMKKANITKIKADNQLFTVSLAKGKTSLDTDMIDLDLLDFGYFDIVRKPKTKKIKEELEKGLEVSGVPREALRQGNDYAMIRMGKGQKELEE